MPLFEYICQACGKPSELLVTGSREPACPHCGSKKLEKQLSRFSAQVSSASCAMPPCGSGGCPSGGGCSAGGGCPHTHH